MSARIVKTRTKYILKFNYDLAVKSEMKRQGIGKSLFQILQIIAKAIDLEKHLFKQTKLIKGRRILSFNMAIEEQVVHFIYPFKQRQKLHNEKL